MSLLILFENYSCFVSRKNHKKHNLITNLITFGIFFLDNKKSLYFDLAFEKKSVKSLLYVVLRNFVKR